jgi:small-conductance mechanosensitive channel
MNETLQSLLDRLPDNVWLQALTILVASLVVAKLADWIITGFARSLTRKTRSNIDDQILSALHRPIFVSVLLLGLGTIDVILAPPEPFGTAIVRIFKTTAICIWAFASVKITVLLLDGLANLSDKTPLIEEATVTLFSNIGRVVIYGGAVYWALVTWDINVGPMIASAGIVGLSIGLAAKDTLANLFAGVFILADKPYSPGDFVNLDNGQRGMVTHIGLRSTRLITRDDIEVTVPNSVIGQATILNESGGEHEKTRIRVKVGVAYGSDIDLVCETLEAIAVEHAEICGDPEPRVRFRTFGDSSLDFELLCWVEKPVLRGRVLHELNCEVYRAFGRRGIQIPFPQRDVHLIQPPHADPESA